MTRGRYGTYGQWSTPTSQERAVAGLERWYAERGSRDMAHRPPLPPVTPCGVPRCPNHAKRSPVGMRCADHWPASVR